ncbi:26S proteasome regulatory subunit RPN9 [Intoshia linei]|uniref:26S proteasome non-ATPase regulatory subunit 13 n=1 Tax=Intoshia linei TaxID=1819745 RepID=A0A177AYH1_9BILA|nr:26S proteasome regulatory subunit RPN9 [Intoshia linei]
MSEQLLVYLDEKLKMTSNDSHLNGIWTNLKKFYTEKLWHHLTLAICEILSNPDCKGLVSAREIYQNLVSKFEGKINLLALANICCKASKEFENVQEKCEFLNEKKSKIDTDFNAKVLIISELALIHIANNDKESTRKLVIDNNEVKDISGVHYWVQAKFYKATNIYYQMIGQHTQFYNHIMRYISCVDVDDLPVTEKIDSAYKASLAVILSRDIYNFGELLAHPIMKVIHDDLEKFWVYDLIHAFNYGNVKKFFSLKEKWSIQPDLLADTDFMIEKMAQMALMELALQNKTSSKPISFQQIAEFCGISSNEVDEMIMKSMANNLIDGKVDDVDEILFVDKIQTRVLQNDQIIQSKERLNKWIEEINKIKQFSSKYIKIESEAV